MEKTISDFSISLLLWQILVFILLLIIIYYLIKLYKKASRYFDKNSK